MQKPKILLKIEWQYGNGSKSNSLVGSLQQACQKGRRQRSCGSLGTPIENHVTTGFFFFFVTLPLAWTNKKVKLWKGVWKKFDVFKAGYGRLNSNVVAAAPSWVGFEKK